MTDTTTKIRKIIVDTLACDAARVENDETLLADLGADSLDGVELAMMLEDEFGLLFEDGVIEDCKTVGDVIAAVGRGLADREGAEA